MSTAVRASAAPQRQGGFKRFWQALRQLFHEIVGAVFAMLALGWLNTALRAWTRDAARWLVAIPVAVALLFVFFSVTSFRKARRL
jgi:hypothetical protein